MGHKEDGIMKECKSIRGSEGSMRGDRKVGEGTREGMRI